MEQFQSALGAISISNFWLVLFCSAGVMMLVDAVHRHGDDLAGLVRGSLWAVVVLLWASPVADRLAGVPSAVALGCEAVAAEYAPGSGMRLSQGDEAAVGMVCGTTAAVRLAMGADE